MNSPDTDMVARLHVPRQSATGLVFWRPPTRLTTIRGKNSSRPPVRADPERLNDFLALQVTPAFREQVVRWFI